MKRENFKRLIANYLDDDTPSSQHQVVDHWYHSFDDTKQAPLFDQNNDEQRIKKEIYHNLSGTWKRSYHRRSRMRLMLAASILLATLTAILSIQIWNTGKATATYISYTSSRGAVRKLVLPDKSVVWINAGSTIRVPDKFNQQERQVFLDEGEAFFQVQKDPKHPFIVTTPTVSTRVLGTSFNVRAYRALRQIKVTVATGRVAVSDSRGLMSVLKPDQELCYDLQSGKHTLEFRNAGQSKSWTTGDYWLRNADFNELCFSLSNIYGLQLRSNNADVRHYRFNLKIDSHSSIENTLKTICSIHQNNYRRNGNDVEIY